MARDGRRPREGIGKRIQPGESSKGGLASGGGWNRPMSGHGLAAGVAVPKAWKKVLCDPLLLSGSSRSSLLGIARVTLRLSSPRPHFLGVAALAEEGWRRVGAPGAPEMGPGKGRTALLLSGSAPPLPYFGVKDGFC